MSGISSTSSKDISCNSPTTPTNPGLSQGFTCTKTNSISSKEPCRQVTRNQDYSNSRWDGSTKTASGFATNPTIPMDTRRLPASIEEGGDKVKAGLTLRTRTQRQ